MAKKKTVSKRVQAPKAVKRGRKNKPSHSNGSQGGSRALISSTIPRPYQRLRSIRDDIVEVSGMEILASLSTSQAPDDWQFYLNAGNSEYFKRLAIVAGGYEKFRFRSYRLRYYTAAPATRSGAVSAAVLVDPLSVQPETPQAYMAYANSLVGPISMNLSSTPHKIVDPKWYYVAQSDSNGSGVADPTNRFQGIVCWQTLQSASADASLIAGYLALEYVCELTGHRPTRNLVLNAEPSSQTFNSTNYLSHYDKVPTEVGTYDLQVEGSGELAETVTVPGYTSGTTYSNSFLSYLGKHFVNYYFPLAAASVDGKPVEAERGFVPRPPVSIRRVGKTWTCEVGGALVDTIPRWVEVLCHSREEEKEGTLVHPVLVSSLQFGEEYSLRGNAAGDVTITIISSTPAGVTQTVDSTAYSSGVGALNLRRSVDWNELYRGARILLKVLPTGVENRVCALLGNVSYTETIGDENLFS